MSSRASTASKSALDSSKPSLRAAAAARAASRPTTTFATTRRGRSKKWPTWRSALPCARPMKACPTMATLSSDRWPRPATFLVAAMDIRRGTLAGRPLAPEASPARTARGSRRRLPRQRQSVRAAEQHDQIVAAVAAGQRREPADRQVRHAVAGDVAEVYGEAGIAVAEPRRRHPRERRQLPGRAERVEVVEDRRRQRAVGERELGRHQHIDVAVAVD